MSDIHERYRKNEELLKKLFEDQRGFVSVGHLTYKFNNWDWIVEKKQNPNTDRVVMNFIFYHDQPEDLLQSIVRQAYQMGFSKGRESKRKEFLAVLDLEGEND